MLETELKSIISKETYDKIKAMYPWDSEKLQENHYYADASGILGANRTVFRIRKKDGVFKIQLKIHKNENSPLQICEETEFGCTGAPEKISTEESKKYTGEDIGELIKIGFNITRRCSFMWNDSTEICLDKTDYFDVTDYEIEIEYTGEKPSALIEELGRAGVNFDSPSVGKYTRFIQRFKELMKP